MPRPAQVRPLPLPLGWPRCVRSAVVQVISLSGTSLALTQSWASERKVCRLPSVFRHSLVNRVGAREMEEPRPRLATGAPSS